MNPADAASRSTARLGPGLRWALGLSVVASGLVLLWPQSTLVGAVDVPPRGAASPAGRDASTAAAAPRALPAALSPITFYKPTFDPFAGVVPPPPPPPPVVAAAAPPPPAPPPPMNYRFFGRVIDPSGHPLVYIAKGESTVAAVVGEALEDGYAVESVDGSAVTLIHAATGTRARIPIPADGDAGH